MAAMVTEGLSKPVWASCVRVARAAGLARRLTFWLAGSLLFFSLRLHAQTFVPTLTVGGGIQSSYNHDEPTGDPSLNQFFLNHARLYLSGDITSYISAMINTDYSGTTNNMEILDAAGKFHFSPKVNIWFGRFLPPSDRANLYGPFYSNEWAFSSDGIQSGYPSIYAGRDNGVTYWGDFEAGPAKIKISVGTFDGSSATSSHSLIWASRAQIDFWDPESGYYLNGTNYGDKNILAIAGANQVQDGRTATTADFLMERKVHHGGAFTIESEYSNYNRLGGYDSRYAKSQGGYGLASFLIPKQVGIGKFEILGKYAIAQFTNGGIGDPSYRQNTAEVNLSYIIKQFGARVMSFYKDTRYNAVQGNDWEAGVGLQLQFSKTISLASK
jgi:hypothetical protein